jgi:hypothetical protein
MRPLRTFQQFCREQMDAPTDQHGHILSTFELSMVQFMADLVDMKDYDTVEVTLDDNDPTKVMLRFRGNEDSGD